MNPAFDRFRWAGGRRLTALALAYVMEEGLPDCFCRVPIDPLEAAAKRLRDMGYEQGARTKGPDGFAGKDPGICFAVGTGAVKNPPPAVEVRL